MKYDFDSVVNRKNTNSLKWDLFDVEVPMWVADMDFKVAPEIQEALQLKINERLVKVYKFCYANNFISYS